MPAVEIFIALLLCVVAALLAAVLRRMSQTSSASAVLTPMLARMDVLEKAFDVGGRAVRDDVGRTRSDAADSAKQLREEVGLQLSRLSEANDNRMEALRRSLDDKMRQLQEENMKKLEQMRQTVDEKLQGTLEQRLGESFRLVSERLEAVHKGLGEMHSLAAGVGDLRKVL